MAIGVLALIVAATTVFQGALSAGPGRLKASSLAIGPIYSLKTTTEFSWTELRFRTTARIPYIDHVGWHNLPGSAQPTSISRYGNHWSYGAGWLNLTNLIPRECQQWSLTRCQTDYLPSDVQAAPARASIRAVVELAALSGCDSIQMVENFPLARGLSLQLSFRDHPYLGLVAVYDQFVIEDDKSVTLPFHKIFFSQCHHAAHTPLTHVQAPYGHPKMPCIVPCRPIQLPKHIHGMPNVRRKVITTNVDQFHQCT